MMQIATLMLTALPRIMTVTAVISSPAPDDSALKLSSPTVQV